MNVENLLHPTAPLGIDGAAGCRDGRDEVNILRVTARVTSVHSTFDSEALRVEFLLKAG
jgi:hypothetical protein